MPQYPKFEHNIEDQYTITQNNKVGAENRGNVRIGGTSELRWSSIPQNFGDGKNRETLKEVIEYASMNGYDEIYNRVDFNIDETHFNVPDGIIIEAEDETNWVINLTDFEKARYNCADITVGAVGGCLKSDASDQYSPACANGDDLYYLKDDGTFGTLTRANISGKTYLAVDRSSFIGSSMEELSLVNNAGTIDLYKGNTLWKSGITDVDTAAPKLRSLNVAPDGGYNVAVGLIKSTTAGLIKAAYGLNLVDITIKDPTGNTFNATNWDSDSQFAYAVDLATGLVNGSYISYIYRSYEVDIYKDKAYHNSAYIKTINAKMLTIHLNKNDNIEKGWDIFVGGSQIWYYDDTTWQLQLSLTFEPDNAKFLQAGNMLYFVVGNTTTGRLEIYKKNLNSSISTWVLVRRYFNKRMLYLTHYYDESNFSLRILFKNIVDNKLYYFINKTITLIDRGKLNGIVIKNNASFYDLGQNEFGYDIFTTPVINSTNTSAAISYCSIYANDLNISKMTWEMSNCILKSNKDCLYYRGSSSPVFYNEFKNNLILVGGYAVKIEKQGNDNPTFSSAVFKNNTVKSVNGMRLCTVSSLTVKNNIIDCSFVAFDINTTLNDLMVSNSIVNGQIGNQTILLNCLKATNPLFKDVYNDDYTLMSIAEYYPKDSKAIKFGDNGKDAGCYDVTRTNNGETLKETFDLTGFVADIMRAWEYPKKETGFDYRGNFLKTMSNGTRLIKLIDQWGSINIEKVDYLEYLISKDEPMRFYPYGNNGIPFIIDYTIPTEQTFKTSSTLTCNFTTMAATVPTNHKFQQGLLKGAWLIVNTTKWYYIKDNTETTLYLENKENFTNPTNGSYACSIKWFYVKTPDTIEYNNGIWTETNQEGIFPSLTLYVVESKEV